MTIPFYLFTSDNDNNRADIVNAVQHIAGDIIIINDFYAHAKTCGYTRALRTETYINVEA